MPGIGAETYIYMYVCVYIYIYIYMCVYFLLSHNQLHRVTVAGIG